MNIINFLNKLTTIPYMKMKIYDVNIISFLAKTRTVLKYQPFYYVILGVAMVKQFLNR